MAAAGAAIGVVLAVSACGSGTKVEVVRLRSANPLTQDLYVRVKGPAGAVRYLAGALSAGAFRRDQVGFFLPPSRRHRTALCSFTHIITSEDVPNLQRWRGKTIKLSVYGQSSYAGSFCRALRPAITERAPDEGKARPLPGRTSRAAKQNAPAKKTR